MHGVSCKTLWAKKLNICSKYDIFFHYEFYFDLILTAEISLILKYIHSRRPVPTTNQALPSCFYFRISRILMEQYFFLSPWVSAGPQKPQTLTASKTKYEKFGP